MKYFLTLLLLCSTMLNVSAQSKRKIKKEMDSWMGYTKHELVVNYGPPSRVVSDENGGQIIIFSRRVVRDNPSLQNDGNGGLYVQQNMPYVLYKHRMFYVDKDGVAYAWNYESNQEPPDRLYISADVNVYSR